MAESTKQTVIADGTELSGSLKSKCDVSVSGKVVGELDAPHLMVTSSGSVDGDVTVTGLKSEGSVSGRIVADTIELAGRVSDRTVIHAKTLEVKLSDGSNNGLQVTFGDCELRVDGNRQQRDQRVPAGQHQQARHQQAQHQQAKHQQAQHQQAKHQQAKHQQAQHQQAQHQQPKTQDKAAGAPVGATADKVPVKTGDKSDRGL